MGEIDHSQLGIRQSTEPMPQEEKELVELVQKTAKKIKRYEQYDEQSPLTLLKAFRESPQEILDRFSQIYNEISAETLS